MIDFKYLYQGACGLANAHKAGTMAGHLGAAVAAGYFFGEDQADLPKKVYQGVESFLSLLVENPTFAEDGFCEVNQLAVGTDIVTCS